MIRNDDKLSASPIGSLLWWGRRIGVLALAGTMACGGGGAGADGEAEGEADGADGADDGADDGSSGDGDSDDGAGGGGADCSGNPVTGNELPPVVRHVPGVVVTTFAGSSVRGTDDGPADDARFSNPVSVLIDGDGLLIADFDSGRIRRATEDGTISTLTAQDGFTLPFGLLLAGDRLVVQTDEDDSGPLGGALWNVDLASGAASLVVEQVGRPRGLVMAPSGELVVADVKASVVRVVNADGSLVTLAGEEGCPSFQDGIGAEARFDQPLGMVTLDDGSMLIADMGNHRIRRVTRDGQVSTFAGDGVPGMIDGNAAESRFANPKDLAIDAAGNVYVSDVGNHRIRRIRTDGVVETIAGDGGEGFADGSGEQARFFGQEGLDVTADGKTVFVADGTDGNNDQPYHRVRKITLP